MLAAAAALGRRCARITCGKLKPCFARSTQVQPFRATHAGTRTRLSENPFRDRAVHRVTRQAISETLSFIEHGQERLRQRALAGLVDVLRGQETSARQTDSVILRPLIAEVQSPVCALYGEEMVLSVLLSVLALKRGLSGLSLTTELVNTVLARAESYLNANELSQLTRVWALAGDGGEGTAADARVLASRVLDASARLLSSLGQRESVRWHPASMNMALEAYVAAASAGARPANAILAASKAAYQVATRAAASREERRTLQETFRGEQAVMRGGGLGLAGLIIDQSEAAAAAAAAAANSSGGEGGSRTAPAAAGSSGDRMPVERSPAASSSASSSASSFAAELLLDDADDVPFSAAAGGIPQLSLEEMSRALQGMGGDAQAAAALLPRLPRLARLCASASLLGVTNHSLFGTLADSVIVAALPPAEQLLPRGAAGGYGRGGGVGMPHGPEADAVARSLDGTSTVRRPASAAPGPTLSTLSPDTAATAAWVLSLLPIKGGGNRKNRALRALAEALCPPAGGRRSSSSQDYRTAPAHVQHDVRTADARTASLLRLLWAFLRFDPSGSGRTQSPRVQRLVLAELCLRLQNQVERRRAQRLRTTRRNGEEPPMSADDVSLADVARLSWCLRSVRRSSVPPGLVAAMQVGSGRGTHAGRGNTSNALLLLLWCTSRPPLLTSWLTTRPTGSRPGTAMRRRQQLLLLLLLLLRRHSLRCLLPHTSASLRRPTT